MKISSVKLVYFSPTGTTKAVLEGIAQGLGSDRVEHMDMTLPGAATSPVAEFNDELVVIGAPVYAGRLPADAAQRFRRCKAGNAPAVLVVTYGNRAYEDALLELTNLSRELGFVPVSAAAFIGEHSYATADLPIANGRPDTRDVEKAKSFGAAVMEKVEKANTLEELPPLKVPGNFPYKEGMPAVDAVPKTLEDVCTLCGHCASVCPNAAITVNDEAVETSAKLCIRCCACVKACPEQARIMDHPFINNIAKWLNENCGQRKEPEVFI